MKIVEIRIMHITAICAKNAGWKRLQLDLLAFIYDSSERLVFDEAIEQILYGVSLARRHASKTQVGPAEFAQTPRVVPLCATSLVGDEDDNVFAWKWLG